MQKKRHFFGKSICRRNHSVTERNNTKHRQLPLTSGLNKLEIWGGGMLSDFSSDKCNVLTIQEMVKKVHTT